MRGQAEPKEIKIKIKEDLLTDLEQSPEQVDNWYTNNILIRGLSYLIGFTDRNQARMVRMTDAGAIKVANIGSGLSEVYPVSGTATDTLSSAISLGAFCSQIEINSIDYELNVYTSPNGVTYYGPIYIGPQESKKYDLTTHMVKVERAGLNDAEYTILGFK